MKPNYFWIGHCKEGSSDKVWGILTIREDSDYKWQGDYVVFWGRRGAKLQTKIHKDTSEYTMERLADKKESKGYQKIDLTRLNEVYPEFEKDLSKMAFWAQFKV